MIDAVVVWKYLMVHEHGMDAASNWKVATHQVELSPSKQQLKHLRRSSFQTIRVGIPEQHESTLSPIMIPYTSYNPTAPITTAHENAFSPHPCRN